ncbi:hypothetical protein TrRE_jg4022 [Triparma retinervis]|uniref:SANT and BTB domain-containing protein n=1 Tax=Triparma retinervis TaxID=2557542 RepID=A0A9W7A663_9STRA|nr:hypothetical protein TrRE_jg4022 [Triparma retinervis]
MSALGLSSKKLDYNRDGDAGVFEDKNKVKLGGLGGHGHEDLSAIDSDQSHDDDRSAWNNPSVLGRDRGSKGLASHQRSSLGSGSGGSDDSIVIHIYDESRGVKKDFDCSRKLLLKHMKYFKSYIPDQEVPDPDNGVVAEADDIDISVHCDIYIFEFLVDYMKSPRIAPKFETSSVVSILISSEFLQMDELVVKCLRFIAQNLGAILMLPVDLTCVSDAMCAKLAKLCPAEALVGAVDKKGKLLPRLYKKRLEIDFRERSSKSGSSSTKLRRSSTNSSCLICCRHCYRLFPETEVAVNGGYIRCQTKSSSVAVGFHGELVGRECEPVDEWSLTNFVASLRRQQLEWSNIYWMLWSAAHMLRMEDGGLAPSDSESGCLCHVKSPSFAVATGSSAEVGLWGVYPCCGETALKLNPWELKSERGCGTRALRLAPVVGLHSSQTPLGAGWEQFFNDESRVRIAAKARKALGPGYGTMFQREVKVALDELAQSQSSLSAPSAPIGGRSNSGGGSGNNWALVRTTVNSRGSSGASGTGSSNKRISSIGTRSVGGWKAEQNPQKGNLVCTTSTKVNEQVKRYAAFVNTPLVYRTDAAKSMGLADGRGKGTNSPVKQTLAYVQIGGAPRFVGSEGFVRFASSRGASINTERYLCAIGESADVTRGGAADEESKSNLLAGGFRSMAGSDDALAPGKTTSVINEPVKGLDQVQREALTRATSSKIALTMDASKRTSWYSDAMRQSDVERLRQISSQLASIRSGCDVAEKQISNGKGSAVRSKSNFVRGGSWRNGFTVNNKDFNIV